MISQKSGGTPLENTRVIDFTRLVAGPQCTMCLADFGAEVIKIEDTAHGDDIRHHKPPEIECDAPYFLSVNRNKVSVAVDLTHDDGKTIIHDLLESADVLVENFRTGVMARHGLDYEALRERYPRLIYCAISGYGRDGSQATRGAYDPVVQAESGLMATNGSAETGPMRTGLAITDTTTGLYATQAILAALLARERTGRGQFIEVALYDVAVASLSHYGVRYLLDGKELPRVGNSSNAAQPIGVFLARDGKRIQLTCSSERNFVQLAEAVGRPELTRDPRFATNPKRLENQTALYDIFTEIFATETRDVWVAKLNEYGVPAGAVNELGDALSNPLVEARRLTEQLPHPLVGSVPNLRSPMRLSDTPVRPASAPPMHAQHTDEVLRDVLGYEDDRIDALRRAGTIK